MKNVLQIFKFFYKRFISLGLYIKNIPILYLSLFSFLITLMSTQLYEGIEIYDKNIKIFTIFLLVLSLFFILITLLIYRNVSHSVKEGKSNPKVYVQLLFLAVLLLSRLFISFIKDYKIIKNIESFTSNFKQQTVQVLDISKSKGDIQEIVFEYKGVKGVGRVNWFENLKIGNMCNTYMEIEEPENFEDFNYVRYLKNKNIYLRSSEIKIESCNSEFSIKKLSDIFLWLKRNLRIFREILSKHVEKYLPEPQASLLIGILFGSERAFSEKFEQQLRISGTTHIIAASGYNVTILILASNKIFNFIKKKYRLLISLLLIWIYCILSGLGASILRATMMGTITVLALLSGNVRNTHLLIPSGVFFLILLNPRIIFDIGFQLSILATLGLIYVLPSIEELLKRIFSLKNVPQFLEDNFLGTISCTLSTLPISISIFGKFSLLSVFANVLVLPLTESTMLYGTIALVSSFILEKFSIYLFSIPYIQLRIFQRIVEFFGSIRWGYIDVKTGWIGWIVGIFLFLFCIYFYPLDEENYYVKRFKDL